MDITAKCEKIEDLRSWVESNLGINTRSGGNLWLPIVLTARGPLYGEVISQHQNGSYKQPYPLTDRVKQSLFRLGHGLITYLCATPGVYLVQFSLNSATVEFDRLIPYPGEPATASKGVQEPDLFTCHWLCLERQPIFDLVIRP